MRKIAVLLIVLGSIWAVGARENKAVERLCAVDSLRVYLCGPQAFAPVPKYKDTYWKDSIPEAMRQSFIKEAEKYANPIWPSTDPILFSEFRKNGNRTNYEKFIFDKRTQLATLAMAELMEGEGRFMPEIIRGLHSMCEEIWWGLPAHYPKETPTEANQHMALFSAESGAMVAWLRYLFAEPIKEFSPILYDRLGRELKRRMLDQGLNVKEWWYGCNMNWNPWICANWLATVLLAESDRDRQLQTVADIAVSLDGFIDQYPDDGGCDEGPAYYDRATGALLEALNWLSLATDGYVDLSGDEKLHTMAAYLGQMMIDRKHAVNFADSSPMVRVAPELFPGALCIKDADLMNLSAAHAKNVHNYFEEPSPSFQSGCIPSMGRELMVLRVLPAMEKAAAASPEEGMPFDSWMPTIQVIAARSKPNSAEGLYFAAKGGNNAESHNHNDVGSFIVYADGAPLLIDPGRATYNANSFNNRRYEQWHVQSGYHNLPIINGVEQKDGAQFRASGAKADIGKKRVRFSLDIAGAYPQGAGVDKWVRSFDFQRGKDLKIKEEYALQEASSLQIVLMTPCNITVDPTKGVIVLGDSGYAVNYDPSEAVATEEVIAIDDEAMAWKELRRIMLTPKTASKKGTISYSISAI